jgi:shikimate 5-dehydrogenase
MKRYYSISQYPGTTGQYYYSWFFKQYSIDATYTPIGCLPDDFDRIVSELLLQPDTSGISVSMPYKSAIIQHCIVTALSVTDYDSCNTVVVTDSGYIGHNCDLAGVVGVTRDIAIDTSISVLGNGAIGKMFYEYLQRSKYTNVKLYSRSIGNWSDRHSNTEVVINCTALGTSSHESPLERIPDGVTKVIDLSVNAAQLSQQCHAISYVGGMEFYRYQFIDQFERYTGIAISPEQFEVARKQR